MSDKQIAPIRLYLLAVIVNRKRAEYYTHLIRSMGVNLQFRTHAHGTVQSDVMELLGLSDTLKSVIFAVVPGTLLDDICAVLEEKFKTVKDGRGVCAAVPFSSVIGTGIFRFMADDRGGPVA